MKKYIWVDTQSQLQVLAEDCMKQSRIGLDTEFIHRKTYHPVPALLQLSVGDVVYLVDVVTLKDIDLLKPMLTSPNIVKILHSAKSDLDVLYILTKTVVSPIFDTQIAEGLVGDRSSASYQYIVEKYMDTELDKGETMSDWLQRPLTESQVDYAAADVKYLMRLHDHYVQQLSEMQRSDWMREECEQICAWVAETNNPDFIQRRLCLGYKQSTPQQRAVLRALECWRENRARDKNLPRPWILHDKGLQSIAKYLPRDPNELLQCDHVTSRFVGRNAKHILKLIEETLIQDENIESPVVSCRDQDQLVDIVREHEKTLGLLSGTLLTRNEAKPFLLGAAFRKPMAGRLACAWRNGIIDTLLN